MDDKITYRHVCASILLSPLEKALSKEQECENTVGSISGKYMTFDVKPYLPKLRNEVLKSIPQYQDAFNSIDKLGMITTDDCDDTMVKVKLDSTPRAKKILNTKFHKALNQARDIINDNIDDNIWQAIDHLCSELQDSDEYVIDSYHFEGNKIRFIVDALSTPVMRKLSKIEIALKKQHINVKMSANKSNLYVYANTTDLKADKRMIEIIAAEDDLNVLFGTTDDYPADTYEIFATKSADNLDILAKAVSIIKPFLQ